jgi:hypothetical protein
MPHPIVAPPGLHDSNIGQSLSRLHCVLPASSTREASAAASRMGAGQLISGQLPATQKSPPLQSAQRVGDPGGHEPPSARLLPWLALPHAVRKAPPKNTRNAIP